MLETQGMDDREVLLQALKGYLEDLRDTGVDELVYEDLPALHQAPVQSAAAAVNAAASVPATAPATETGLPAGTSSASVAPAAQAATPETLVASERDLCSSVGNPQARLLLMMTGDGFSGEAGSLLANIIKAMKFEVDDVHLITFPPAQAESEAATIRTELLRRMAAVAPEAAVAFGETTARLLLASDQPIEALRGKFHNLGRVRVMATLHPEALVADASLKRQVWNEMQQVMKLLAGPS